MSLARASDHFKEVSPSIASETSTIFSVEELPLHVAPLEVYYLS